VLDLNLVPSGSGDVNLKCILLDNGAGPHALHQVILGDEFAARLNQGLYDFERATTDRHRGSVRPQLAPDEINLPRSEFVHPSLGLRRHPLSQEFFGFIQRWRSRHLDAKISSMNAEDLPQTKPAGPIQGASPA